MELLTFRTEQTDTGRMAIVTLIDDNGQRVTRQMDYDKAVLILSQLGLEERRQKPSKGLKSEMNSDTRL